MAFKKACTLDDIWEGDMETFDVDGTEVLLVHVEGEGIHAVQAQCPHQEVDLVDGDLDGRVLTCMMHLWEFDIVAGKGGEPGPCRDRPVPGQDRGRGRAGGRRRHRAQACQALTAERGGGGGDER